MCSSDLTASELRSAVSRVPVDNYVRCLLATGTRLTADRSSLAVGPTEMGSESIKISTLSLSNLENPKLDSAQDATPFS